MRVDDGALRDILLDSGVLTRRQLNEIENSGESLFDVLSRKELISLDELRRAAAAAAGIPFVVLRHEDIDPRALSLIPEPIARRENVTAFRASGNSIEVALLDLAALDALEFLREKHAVRILPRFTTQDSIKRALLLYHKHLKEKFGEKIKGKSGPDEAADALLAHALMHHALEVHLEPREFFRPNDLVGRVSGEQEILVRYRIEGRLMEAMTLPREALSVVARLKELGGLSLTLPVPQEGSFKAKLQGQEEVRVRVASLPTISGERIVLTITPVGGGRRGFSLHSLGFHGESLERMHRILRERRGLVLVAGEGKTTLLYTMLDHLAHPARAVVSVEEKIEYRLPQISQTVVRPEIGLDTGASLRAVLKQDPDIVCIDAIRDARTAELAESAATRGIFVIASAENPEILPARVLVKTLVVRRVCQKCKEEFHLSRSEGEPFEAAGASFAKVLAALKDEGVVAESAQWKDILFARASGCRECDGGYKGYIGLQEIVEGGEASGLNLIEDGLFKAVQGQTSLEEIARLINTDDFVQ